MNSTAYQVPPSAMKEYQTCKAGYHVGNEMQRLKNDESLYGIAAHELAEILLRAEFVRRPTDADRDHYRRFTMNNLHYNQQMESQVKQYIDACNKVYEFHSSADSKTGVVIERPLEFGSFSDAKGKVDFALVGNGMIEIIDFKTGRKKVSARDNQQMMLYAIALMRMYQKAYNIEKVALTVIQPQISSVPDRVVMTWQELLAWGEKHRDALKSLDLTTGEDVPHCGQCRLKSACVHAAEYFVKEADYIMSKDPLLHNIEDVVKILDMLPDMTAYAERFKKDWVEVAIQRYLNIPGYKVIHGNVRNNYTDDRKVVEQLMSRFPDVIDELAPRKPLTANKMKEAIGDEAFGELIGSQGLHTYKENAPRIVQEHVDGRRIY